jgi:hypothetical protein
VKIDGKSIEVLHRSPSKMMDNGDLSWKIVGFHRNSEASVTPENTGCWKEWDNPSSWMMIIPNSPKGYYDQNNQPNTAHVMVVVTWGCRIGVGFMG